MQPTYMPETIDSSIISYFINIKMESNIINVDIGFSHANYSSAFVSDIFHQIFCYLLVCSSK